MDDDLPCIDTFSGSDRTIAVDVAGVDVRCSRVGFTGPGLIMSSEPDDAVALIYQVADSGPHDLWLNGRHNAVGSIPAGVMQLLDLDAAGHSRHETSFDSVNVHIPMAALRALGSDGYDLGAVRPRMGADWSTNDPFIHGIMPVLLMLLEGNSTPDRLVSEHLFSALLSHVATAYGTIDASEPIRTGRLTARQLNRLKQLLGDDLTRDVSLAELARECNLSPSHVSRTFKAATGMSPFAWRAQVRVDAGKELLRQGGSTISDIAAHCGFADQSHFTRTFQRLVGDSPKRWQRRREGP